MYIVSGILAADITDIGNVAMVFKGGARYGLGNRLESVCTRLQ